MIVVADTSPLNYLILIGHVGVLPRLYARVLIPPAVVSELRNPSAPGAVREWMASQPAWIEVVSPLKTGVFASLDLGECQAIALAVESGAGALLIDDLAGRREAMRRGLAVAGTLSVLDDADQGGLLSFDDAVARLRNTSFRLSQAVLAEIMRKRAR